MGHPSCDRMTREVVPDGTPPDTLAMSHPYRCPGRGVPAAGDRAPGDVPRSVSGEQRLQHLDDDDEDEIADRHRGEEAEGRAPR